MLYCVIYCVIYRHRSRRSKSRSRASLTGIRPDAVELNQQLRLGLAIPTVTGSMHLTHATSWHSIQVSIQVRGWHLRSCALSPFQPHFQLLWGSISRHQITGVCFHTTIVKHWKCG